MQNFQKCSDLESLRRLTAEAGVDIRAYSRLAFRQLLENERPIKELFGFLEDSALNNPKVKNLKFLLGWQLSDYGNKINMGEFLKLLSPWIRLQIGLGKLTMTDFQCVMEFASSLTQSSRGKTLKTDLLEAMITGVEECNLMSISDLKRSTLQGLLDCLSTGESVPRSLSLLCRVLKGLSQTQLQELHVNLQNFIFGIFRIEVDCEAFKFSEIKTDFAQMVHLIPDLMKIEMINQISKIMIGRASSDSSYAVSWSKSLKLWWSVLTEHGLFALTLQGGNKSCVPYHILRKPLAITIPYLYHLDDRKIALILLQYWWRAPQRLRNEYNYRLQDHTNEPFGLMLKIAQDHLPERSKSYLVEKLLNLLQLMHRHDKILDIVGQASHHQIRLSHFTVSSLIRSYISINPRFACKLFWSSPQLRMEQFPELAEHMIDNIRLHPSTVWHNIRHRDCIRISDLDRPQWRKDRARLFEKMAHRYAKARHLSPRMSFRHLYRCYIYHMKDRLGPVGKGLSRSLTRAGVIRPLQRKQWVSSVKLRWILSIVRAAEGDA